MAVPGATPVASAVALTVAAAEFEELQLTWQRTSTQTQAPEPLSCDEFFLTVPLKFSPLYTGLNAETISASKAAGLRPLMEANRADAGGGI